MQRNEMQLLQRVLAFCRAQNIFSTKQSQSVLVAVSGGRDSMALLDILCHLAKSCPITSLAVAHFEHGIRGEASRADAEFVQSYCEARMIPFFVKYGDVLLYARQKKMSLEQAARVLRYDFLRTVKEKIGAQVIALAHHADDQAETMFLHMLRGSGLQGLLGMQAKSHDLVRPLLFLRRAEIAEYVQARHIPYREDATNADTKYTRNFLRHKVFPLLEKHVNPKTVEAMGRLASLLAAEHDFLEVETQKALQSCCDMQADKILVQRKVFANLPLAMARRVLHVLGQRLTPPDGWSANEVERLRHLLCEAQGEKQRNLPQGVRCVLTYATAIFQRQEPTTSLRNADVVKLAVPGHVIFEGQRITADFVTTWHKQAHDEVFFDADAFDNWQTLCIRTRRAGDKILLEMGQQKLKELFINRKVPRAKREHVPLIFAGEQLLWVVGMRRANLFPVTARTKNILRLRAQCVKVEGAS